MTVFDLSSNQVTGGHGKEETALESQSVPTIPEVRGSATQAKTSTKEWGKPNTGGKQEMRGPIRKLQGVLCRNHLNVPALSLKSLVQMSNFYHSAT